MPSKRRQLGKFLLPVAISQKTGSTECVGNRSATHASKNSRMNSSADKVIVWVWPLSRYFFHWETDLTVFDIQQPVVGEGHAVDIAAHRVEHLLGSRKGPLGVDHPFGVFGAGDTAGKTPRFAQGIQGTEELQFAGVECFL